MKTLPTLALTALFLTTQAHADGSPCDGAVLVDAKRTLAIDPRYNLTDGEAGYFAAAQGDAAYAAKICRLCNWGKTPISSQDGLITGDDHLELSLDANGAIVDVNKVPGTTPAVTKIICTK